MFKENKYTNWYYSIIDNAKLKDRRKGSGEYYERHHIIPKCEPFNGSNTKDNLILLTAREHFICHWLLTKMCDGIAKWKMQYAIKRMLHNQKRMKKNLFSKIYFEIAKKQYLEAKHPMQGRKHSEETKLKMGVSASLRRMDAVYPRRKGRKMTEEYKMKHIEMLTGRPVSEETRIKLRESNVGKQQNKTIMTCQKCGCENYATQIKRYHNDNCKKAVI